VTADGGIMTRLGRIGEATTGMKKSPGPPGRMKLPVLAAALLLGSLSASRLPGGTAALPQSRPLQHDVRVVNIEVPVRVFDGDSFVENLTIDDFEVLENGVPQKLQAIYLVKKSAVERKEEKAPFAPKTDRNFFLVFQINDYNPKIADAVQYFTGQVLRPGDNLTVVTAVRPYHLKKEWIEKSSKDEIARQLVGLVRRDTLIGNTEYLSILNELKRMVSGGGVDGTGGRQPDLSLFGEGTWQEFLMNYRDLRERLEKIRALDAERLLSFADYLKKTEGQKNVLLFYQKEYMPMVNRNQYIGRFESAEDFIIEQDFKDLFDLYKRDVKIEADRIKKTFADASIAIHFLFLTAAPEPVAGMGGTAMEEHSEDIYSPFLEMAKATGGVMQSSSNAAALMRTAGEASENYYLLYYKPENPETDGKFREIKITVKNKSYRILYRAGYFAK
jgi:VWFA-related protein